MAGFSYGDLLAEIEVDGKFVSLYKCRYPINREKYAIFIEGIEEPFKFTSRKAVDLFLKDLDVNKLISENKK